jgi:hypothetical protein
VKGYKTSFVGLFAPRDDGGQGIASIEIPLIQRDYAQGRESDAVEAIRTSFLDVLLEAVASNTCVSLDFVYGKVDRGTFRPLDGQQRLTTLFLLHWYFASAAGQLDSDATWTKFSYATRASARLFCRELTLHPRPHVASPPRAWITDQPWYLHVWRDDPTISGMLVMLDSIHDAVADLGLDPTLAWTRLNDTAEPAVAFYLLPLDDMDSDEDLYIKMNSRGKPLTPFEAFKARFEQDISHSNRAKDFARKIDGPWSDLMWSFHGGDYIADDEFVRYIDFITEMCELRDGRMGSGRLGPRARTVFGSGNDQAERHLDFLFKAFDTWTDGADINTTFAESFSTALPGSAQYDPGKALLFAPAHVNLFEHCSYRFEASTIGRREFTLQQSLLLYAVLLHRIETTADFPRRLRVLRNLIAASEDEIRRQNMPELVADVERVIRAGDLEHVVRFSKNQVVDELRKGAFLEQHPELSAVLFRLEDHDILRGTLSSFELNAETFFERAVAFERVFTDPGHWLDLTGALLATGDYQRLVRGKWYFGTSSARNQAVWRFLLTSASLEDLSATRDVLAQFLDGVATSELPIDEHLTSVIADSLTKREVPSEFDWRYHLVKYPAMRSGATGIYVGVDEHLGYSMCMLNATQLNGYYWDPFLLAVWEASGVGELADNHQFIGYAATPRFLRLVKSYTGIRSVEDGFEIQRPTDAALAATLDDVCIGRDDIVVEGERMVLRIPQVGEGLSAVDTADRVLIGAEFLRQLVDAGL